MPKIKEFGTEIVAAVDLTGDWTNVAEHAARIGAQAGAHIHLLHVIEPPHSGLARTLSRRELKAHNQRLEDAAVERLDEVASELASEYDVDITSASIVGKRASSQILEFAEDEGAGLIVVGAGVTEHHEWLFVGTTCDRILRNSRVPVLVCGPEMPHRLEKVLIPTDLDRPDQAAVRLGGHLAAMDRGKASVLHAYAQPSMHHRYLGDLAALRREMREEAETSLQKFVAKTRMPPGVPRPRAVLRACTDTVDPAGVIVGEAASMKADLIVMALGGITFLESFMIGAVAEKVIRELPCSLLALPLRWAKKN